MSVTGTIAPLLLLMDYFGLIRETIQSAVESYRVTAFPGTARMRTNGYCFTLIFDVFDQSWGFYLF